MNNNEFNVNDYKTFDDGISQLSGNINTTESNLESINKDVTTLFSEDVFSGPIASLIKEDCNSKTEALKNSISELSEVGTGLNEINSNYQFADISNSRNIADA